MLPLPLPLPLDPGERWMYGINIDWAGPMVEGISGQKPGPYLAEQVLRPMGMANTALRARPDMQARVTRFMFAWRSTAQAPVVWHASSAVRP